MAPPSLWSGNLRLSLVLIPVRLVPAVSTDCALLSENGTRDTLAGSL